LPREIEGVIKDLSRDVESVTQGAVHVEIAKKSTRTTAGGIYAGIVDQISPRIVDLEPVTESSSAFSGGLFAVSRSANQRLALCDIKISEHGYPVEIRYPGTMEQVHDRESLVVALITLLRTPAAAGKIRQLAIPETA
jgi:hypothetical protein